VAGVAALVRAHHPTLSAAGVRRRLELTADHPASRVPDPGVGFGVVNPHQAVTAVLPEEPVTAGAGTTIVVPPRVHPPDPGGTAPLAVLSVTGAALLAASFALTRTVLRLGRARGWRPAGALPSATGMGDQR
jgi:membrane-anchored mycosin MYCP